MSTSTSPLSSEASPQSASQSASILSDSEGEYIVIKCGSVDGKLYFNLLRDSSGNQGSVKCILHNKARYNRKVGESNPKTGKNLFNTMARVYLQYCPLLPSIDRGT